MQQDSVEFRAAGATDQSEVVRFLGTVFGGASASVSFRADVFAWKYFQPHPDWPGTRSFIAIRGGRIVAHAGVWPVQLKRQNAAVRAVHLIDWAADPAAPGVGVLLLRKLAGMADVLIAIGGSDDTRQILPKLGFRQVGTLTWFARVVRPWLQARSSPRFSSRTPARLLRNVAWAATSARSSPEHWRAEPIATFPRTLQPILDRLNPPVPTSIRSVDALNYFLACPAAGFSGFLLHQESKLHGYFLLSRIGHQARVVDLWLESPDVVDWTAASAVAAAEVARDPAICEIAASASVDPAAAAWRRAGFRSRRFDPVFVYDPERLIAPSLPLGVGLTDNDFCFLTDPERPYLT
jgi:hypothetical protein